MDSVVTARMVAIGGKNGNYLPNSFNNIIPDPAFQNRLWNWMHWQMVGEIEDERQNIYYPSLDISDIRCFKMYDLINSLIHFF